MNPGIYNLGDATITTAAVGSVITDGTSPAGEDQDFIDRLEGILAAAVQFRFSYGAGGTSVRAYLQTTLDQGTTWIDIACVLFTTASEVAAFNFSGLTPKTTALVPADGALADDTTVDGILGDRLRVKVTSTGTYSNTTLSVRAMVR